ncbi:MAG TPA: ABC transporter substrate-binding protein [Syntrophobacteraceae bacterium]|nr:ABC transporter substrate-binding protein [Syntrophobacteraceae bacterium]
MWRISCVCCAILIICAAGMLIARPKQEADPARGKDQGGKVLRFDVFCPIGPLDPKPRESDCALIVFNFLYSYLFAMKGNGQLEPDLAARWDYDKASFTWTIQIREGAQFHDGSLVTASDVAYSLSRDMEMALPSEYSLLDRITSTDERMISVRLKKDDPVFLQKIAGFPIVKQPKTVDAEDSRYPIGSGPFQFEYRIGNSEIGLVANEHYYLGRPAVDKVVFYYQPVKERSWARLLAGETDLALGIEPQDYRIMEHYGDRFFFRTEVEPFIITLLYNTHDIYLSDSRVRIALSCAIDREYIVRVILGGMGVVPPGNLGYYCSLFDSSLKPTPYDPSRSMQLLREAGWTYDPQGLYLQKDEKPFDLTILSFEQNRLHESIARYVQLCLSDLGIRVYIQPVPFDELLQRYWRKADFQAAITEFSDGPKSLNDPLINLPLLQWQRLVANPRIAWIADRLSQETDSSRRKALLDELNSLLDSFQPATSLVQKTSLDVLSKRFVLPCGFSYGYNFKLWQIFPAPR